MPVNNVAIVVEDDDDIRGLIEFILGNQGYSVTGAADGEAALALLNTFPQVPKIVVLDIMLPMVDGIVLLQHIRAKAGWENVPVLMLTAKSQEAVVLRAMEAGASDYMIKPFEPMDLIMRVQRLSA